MRAIESPPGRTIRVPRFTSIRARLTLWYMVILAVTLAIFSGGVYLALQASVYRSLDDSIQSRISIIRVLSIEDGDLAPAGLTIPGDPREGEEFARVYDANGQLIFDNSGEEHRPSTDANAVQEALAGNRTTRRAAAGDGSLRVITAPIRTDSGVVGAVEVGLSDEDARETLTALLVIIAIAYPLALVVTSGGGVFLAGRALAPIDSVTRMARQIGAEDLSQRLALDLPDDEAGRLATTFDQMIERLDEAFRRQRQFTADASHEMRTPLTAIKGQTEVALQWDRSPKEYRDVLGRVNAEVDRLIRLVGSLLTLARADAARIPINREELSVESLVSDAIESVRPAAARKGQSLTVEPGVDAHILADQDLMLQLLLNLLDNAVKYTQAGGSIRMSWKADGNRIELSIAGTGPGIAADKLPHVFERFFRVDQARSRAQGGANLGLSICSWIAEAHGGSITVESKLGEGTTFRLSLPAA